MSERRFLTTTDKEGFDSQFSQLSEEIVKSVNGFTPDDTGAVRIEYEVEFEQAYRHTGLSQWPKKITVYSNDLYTNQPLVCLGRNYWPSVKSLEGRHAQHGLSFRTDGNNISVVGTATAGAGFRLAPEDGASRYWPLSDTGLVVGDSVNFYVYGVLNNSTRAPIAVVAFYDENKTNLGLLQLRVQKDAIIASTTNDRIPDNTQYVTFEIRYTSGDTHDNTIFPVLVKSTDAVIENLSFVDGEVSVITDNTTETICTAPYKSTISNEVDLKTYIDLKTNDVDENSSIVTPEMFGASGDNIRDDTFALQACVDYGIANGKKIVAGGEYLISSPIIISGSNLNIEFSRFTYTGADCAFVISGSWNKVRIGFIYSSNKVAGVRLKSDVSTSFNEIHIGRIMVGGNAVEYILTNSDIITNTLTFEELQAGTDCYGIYQTPLRLRPSGVNHTNNNFIGGAIRRGLWAVYGAQGRDTYMTCHMEGTTHGIYFEGLGTCRVISPRFAEVAVSAFDENYDWIQGQGVVFAIGYPSDIYDVNTSSHIQAFDIIGSAGEAICPENIDIRNTPIMYTDDDNTRKVIGKGYPGGARRINMPLEDRGTRPLARNFLIFGKHILIDEPTTYQIKTVTANDSGYTGDYTETDNDYEFYIYSEYEVTESGCDYTLPPSYDVIAFNRFIVRQAADADCIFRDWRGTVIFDGSAYGEGVYEVRAMLQMDSVGKFRTDNYDNINQKWIIRRMSDYALVDTMPHEEATE